MAAHCSGLVRSYLEHCSPFSVAPFKKYSENLRGFEMRTTRNNEVTKPSKKRLKEMGMFYLEKRKLGET